MTLNPQKRFFCEFVAISASDTHFKSELHRYGWIDLDTLRRGTAKTVARLMSFVQITCHFFLPICAVKRYKTDSLR